eukprot:1300454-Alexandrium_andersonii.AAC.1
MPSTPAPHASPIASPTPAPTAPHRAKQTSCHPRTLHPGRRHRSEGRSRKGEGARKKEKEPRGGTA